MSFQDSAVILILLVLKVPYAANAGGQYRKQPSPRHTINRTKLISSEILMLKDIAQIFF